MYNIATECELLHHDQLAGYTVLSQIGQSLSLDHRDSKIDPHTGYLVTLRHGCSPGLGGNAHFVRTKLGGQYFIPLDRFTGNSDWGIAMTGGIGYLFNVGQQEQIIDRFFLGGDNLRGFQSAAPGRTMPITGDPLGGRFIWTQSTELRFPLPISADIGLSGRAFVDIGGLTQASFKATPLVRRAQRAAMRQIIRLPSTACRRRFRDFLAHSVRSVKR